MYKFLSLFKLLNTSVVSQTFPNQLTYLNEEAADEAAAEEKNLLKQEPKF